MFQRNFGINPRIVQRWTCFVPGLQTCIVPCFADLTITGHRLRKTAVTHSSSSKMVHCLSFVRVWENFSLTSPRRVIGKVRVTEWLDLTIIDLFFGWYVKVTACTFNTSESWHSHKSQLWGACESLTIQTLSSVRSKFSIVTYTESLVGAHTKI